MAVRANAFLDPKKKFYLYLADGGDFGQPGARDDYRQGGRTRRHPRHPGKIGHADHQFYRRSGGIKTILQHLGL